MSEQIIGNYRVIKQIGAGGMAKVYLAVHREIANLKVILKILSDPRLVERFKQEADKLALLDGHANICRIKHFFTHGDDVVIAMEYIDGVTLEEKLENEGELGIEEAITITAEVLDILHFAHERGIYHRDIKPGNIMIDQSGTVKIIDFGIAKAKSDPNLTIAGTACGTPAYMAPEQFTPSEDTDYARVDIYAAGATLFKMLTRELPHKGENEFALRDAKLFQDPVKPRSVRPGISRELENCILRSIAKLPEDRYATAAEMRDCLLAIAGKGQEKQGEHTVGMVDTAKSPKRPKGSGSSKKLLAIMLPSVLVVIVAIGWSLGWFEGGEAPKPPDLVTVLSPTDGAVFVDDATPTLTWQADPTSGANYIVEYATDSLFSDSRTLSGGNSGHFDFPAKLDNGKYYYRLYALGADGRRSDPSPARTFAIEVAEAAPAKGTISIALAPRGDVYINGERVARRTTSFDTLIDTGSYNIRVANTASVEGAFTEPLAVTTDQTTARSYRFKMAPRPDPNARSEPEPGEVRVGSKPRGAAIYIDGQLQEQQTNYTFWLEPGRHVIRATLDMGHEILEREDTIEVVSDSTHKVLFDFE